MKEYVIWNFEAAQWWLPGRVGYTSDLSRAGRFSRADAAMATVTGIVSNDYAVHLTRAEWSGPPKYHPYKGEAE